MSNRLRWIPLVVCLVLAALPASAQSKWGVEYPLVLGLAEKGLLVTVAAPDFMGCTDAETWVAMTGLPKLALWSVVWVNDTDAPTQSARWVVTPFGTLTILQQADTWLRVFAVTPEDLDAWVASPCTFYATHPYLAEGLGRINYHSADDSVTGPGVNTWGWTITGRLQDNGYCNGGGSPSLFWLNYWVNRSPSDVYAARSTAAKGPTLTCK